MHKTVHASICFQAASKILMGTTLFFPNRVPVSAKEVDVLYPKTVSQRRIRRDALEPVEGESSGKSNTLMSSPTPLVFLV